MEHIIPSILFFSLAVFVALLVVVMVTPIPAFMCFSAAWGKDRRPSRSAIDSIAIVLVTSVFPVALLALYAILSYPTTKVFGTDIFADMLIGESAWACLPPFAGANYLVARTALNPDYVRQTPLAPLSLVTCLLISIFFTVGTVNEGPLFLFCGSAACAYGYGLCLLIRLQGLPKLVGKGWLLLLAWGVTMALTVLALTVSASIVRTQQMVDEQPKESSAVAL